MDCRHRWYHLVRSCSDSTNLGNCPSKLGLEGWEIKCDFCPFCAAWNVDDGNYRLVGNDRSPSIGGLSRSGSMALSSQRRESRRGSLARTDSNCSMTMIAASEKNKALNARLDAYLSTRPERILSVDSSSRKSDIGDDDPPSPTDTGSSGGDDRFAMLSKGWKKSKRLSRSFFR